MTTQTVQTIDPKNLTFLPEQARKFWNKKNRVQISISSDSIIIKKTKEAKTDLTDIREKLKRIGKQITQKDIEEAIRWARSQKSN